MLHGFFGNESQVTRFLIHKNLELVFPQISEPFSPCSRWRISIPFLTAPEVAWNGTGGYRGDKRCCTSDTTIGVVQYLFEAVEWWISSNEQTLQFSGRSFDFPRAEHSIRSVLDYRAKVCYTFVRSIRLDRTIQAWQTHICFFGILKRLFLRLWRLNPPIWEGKSCFW